MISIEFFKKGLISLSIAFALITFLSKYSQIAAQTQDLHQQIGTVLFNPPVPEDNGAPSGSREGAGSHSLCKIANPERGITPLIAIMPEVSTQNKTKNKVYVEGKTTSNNPTLWFYVAYPVNSQVEFILQDEAENEIYQSTFSLDETQGIVGLTLPEDKIELEKDKNYHWYLYIMCAPESSPDDFVEGRIQRVELNSDIKNKLELAEPIERISIYAENGLWLDTLTSLENLRQVEQNNRVVSNIWTDLLQQVNLDKISQKPIIKKYILEP